MPNARPKKRNMFIPRVQLEAQTALPDPVDEGDDGITAYDQAIFRRIQLTLNSLAGFFQPRGPEETELF